MAKTNKPEHNRTKKSEKTTKVTCHRIANVKEKTQTTTLIREHKQ